MKKITTILLCALLPAAVHAQQPRDTVALRELVVTATRLPSARSTLASSVTVLHGAELRERGVRTVEEALRTVSGAALVQTGSYGAFASLFLRGGESDYVQVLIDGVQVNSPGEHFDFGNLTLENVERIELMRGPGSVLYGSDAMTGVVQLFTKQAAGPPRLGFAATGGLGNRVGAGADGAFGSGSFDAAVQGASGGIGYSVGISHFRSEGAYAYNNEHANTGATARLALAAGRNTSIATTVRYGTNKFHYPTDGAGVLVDANQYHVADAIAAGVDVGHRLTSRLQLHTQLGFNRNDDSYNDRPDNSADTLGGYAFYSDERFQRTAADLRLTYTRAATTVTVGGEWESQRERGWNRSETEFGVFDGASSETRTNRAAYAQLLTGFHPVNVQAGVRIEDNELFGNFATYRGGIAAPLTPWLRARISLGTGFKEPRFYEQFATGFVKGNPDLEPETSRSAEGGVDVVASHGLRIGATYFTQSFRNLIQYVGVPAAADAPNYMNLARARAEGVELDAARTAGALTLRATYTWLSTDVEDDGTGDDPLYLRGQGLIRRPAHSGSFTASYAGRAFRLSGSAHFVGERDDLDFRDFPPDRVRLAPYARLDVAGEVPLPATAIRGTFKIENVLDRAYEEARNFPARGRIVFVGISFGP